MKILKLNLDYFGGKPVPEGNLSGAALTENYLLFAVSQKYKEGLEGQLRRMYGRIQNKIDQAIDSKVDQVELEDEQFDFLAKAFAEAKYPVSNAKYVNMLEDEIEKVKIA